MAQPVLLFGIGNPGRGDDGLGPALAMEIQQLQIAGLTVESDYQLTVEDSTSIAQHELVIFVDADISGPEPFYWHPVNPILALGFSTHKVSPGAVLGLSKQIFGSSPEAYLFGIRGYEFHEFSEKLSDKAEKNLVLAFQYIEPLLREKCQQQSTNNIAAPFPKAE